ncbi:MAG: hypothetical protein ACRDSR_26715 [Pseudonocardiaceae bacterium]
MHEEARGGDHRDREEYSELDCRRRGDGGPGPVLIARDTEQAQVQAEVLDRIGRHRYHSADRGDPSDRPGAS